MAAHEKSRSVKRPKRTSIMQVFRDGVLIDEARRRAARKARDLHKRLGHPLIVWQNGRVVAIPPEEIVVDVPADAPRKKRRRAK